MQNLRAFSNKSPTSPPELLLILDVEDKADARNLLLNAANEFLKAHL